IGQQSWQKFGMSCSGCPVAALAWPRVSRYVSIARGGSGEGIGGGLPERGGGLTAQRPRFQALLSWIVAMAHTRTIAVVSFVAASLLLAAHGTRAEDFSGKPIKFLVGASPGGTTDTMARAIAPPLSASLGRLLNHEYLPMSTKRMMFWLRSRSFDPIFFKSPVG